MRIGVDASCWVSRRGYGRFARNLLSRLLELDGGSEYVFFLDAQTGRQADLPPRATRVLVPVVEPPLRAASAYGRRSLSDVWRMSRAMAAQPLDVLFFPSVHTFVPVIRRVCTIVTIHDIIPELHPALIFPTERLRRFWRLKLALAIRQARVILTVSPFAKAGIVRYLRVPASRVEVVLEAPDPAFHRVEEPPRVRRALAKFGLDGGTPYLLYVGGINPHKNLEMLVEGYAEVIRVPEYRGHRLVLAGDIQGDVFTPGLPTLQARLERLGLSDAVIFTGYVEDADLACLYTAAEVTVLPALSEGFGLPGLESAACGTPVVASRESPLPDLLGDAGIFFDPRDGRQLLAALRRVLGDPALRREMGAQGMRRAADFSWDRSAEAARAIFRRAVGAAA